MFDELSKRSLTSNVLRLDLDLEPKGCFSIYKGLAYNGVQIFTEACPWC